MAEYQQQNSFQHFENSADVRYQWKHLYGTTENSTKINPKQFIYVRDDVRKIYIGGLDKEITQEDLREYFGQFGEIQYIDIKLKDTTGQCRGFAFVVYQTLEGLNNVLAHTDHVINGKKIEPKKAIPRRVTLFVGGLSPDLTDIDITRYFRRFAFIVKAEMPYDKVTKQRKGFCFITFDNMRAVTEILGWPRHVIKGTQVEVKVASLSKHAYGIINAASGYMAGMQRNVMGQGGFLLQSGYPPYAPGYYYGGHGYYIPYPGYSPNYSYGYSYYPSYGYPSYGHPSYGYPSYGYPSYVAGAGANCQYEDYEASGRQ